MALLVPNVGEVEMLRRILNYSATGDVLLKLYTSDTAPGETNTHTTYTEMTGMNYAAITLTGAGWVVSTNGGVTTASFAEQTFTLTSGAGAAIYGYYVTNAAGTTLLWAERFSDGPYTIPAGGGAVKVTPTITLE